MVNEVKEKKTHLPVYGVGPVYGVCVIVSAAAGIVLSCMGFFDTGKIPALRIPLAALGVLIAALGFFVWFKAAIRIERYIISNELCTDGIYAVVRNPCYSGVTLVCTGALCGAGNLWLLLLPPVYWAAMTVLMKNTEEKWLYALYGQEYLDYCKRVNRCIPWPKRQRSK